MLSPLLIQQLYEYDLQSLSVIYDDFRLKVTKFHKRYFIISYWL